MKQEKLQLLEKMFGAEKKYVNDGYYRIRTLAEDEKELAYLVQDACGATVVHPQITIKKIGDHWLATKLIDLEVTPVQMIDRNEDTERVLDSALQRLIVQFEDVQKMSVNNDTHKSKKREAS